TPEPIPAPGFWDGVGDGGVNALVQLPTMIPTETSTIIGQVQGTLNAIDAYEQGGIVDAINTANPLMGVVNLGFAIDEGDWYTVGLESVGVAVTVAVVIVGKKLGPKMGPQSARGPPKVAEPPKVRRQPNAATKRDATIAATDANGITRCQYCGSATTDGAGLPTSKEFDHRVPYVRNGGSGGDNIQVACRTCNRSKGAKTPEEWGGPRRKE
ncbi:MAG TPA: HNH endonuclease signature motif containing protein, partial [Polyangium sp.]|nr:HNH endonuclease signature motif containing protein [Polyangium sp.]